MEGKLQLHGVLTMHSVPTRSPAVWTAAKTMTQFEQRVPQRTARPWFMVCQPRHLTRKSVWYRMHGSPQRCAMQEKFATTPSRVCGLKF